LAWRLNNTIQLGYNASEFVVESLENDINVTVEYQATHFAINFSTVNPFGTVTAKVNDEEIEQGELIARGSRIIFTAFPDDGHEVVMWRNNGFQIFDNQTTEFTINSLTTTANVTVEFSRGNKLLASVIINPEGTGTATGDGWYDANDMVTVTATPVGENTFVNWTVEGETEPVSTDATYGFNITEDITLIANFREPLKEFVVTVKSSNDEYGTVEGGGTYTEGTQATIEAIPFDNYEFINWVEEGGDMFATTATYTFTVERDIVLVANFGLVGINNVKTVPFTIYPNPTSGELRITNYEFGITNGELGIEIYDMMGRKLTNFQLATFNSQLNLDVSKLSSGHYVIRFTDNKTSVTQTFVKK
jgi:hypothetical protein